MSNPTIEITPETIQEAYKTLGIEQEVISKAEEMEEEDEGSEEDEKEDSKENKKKKIEKSIFELKEQLQKAEGELSELEGKKEIQKSENDTLSAITALNENIGKKFEAMATINKSLADQLGETREELKKSQEKIQMLEETPIRKSVTTQNYIEKAFQENNDGNKMLSVSQHRNEIQNMLIEKAGFGSDDVIEKSVDSFWSNEMQYFEATNSLHPRAMKKLLEDDKIQIVR